ncbi:MAG: 50S ribosomal protein L22 [Candidatus Sungbacteria bacterium RIFCSPLOWO2_01_FULL_60_25]|uniref:Large ribosomal subunit protein uL22 n=1 Tax=Candidatus Sungbacteria bacterium RIFCSPLOWO2_01_FULL_60_25 TaxID=1802281 RepID=A0A1G2L9S2_9BACT|nr:MAG: 50S ribosomal protein L22 [Candidatus Sungbacteria bacterium RIFCSPLOWO2_01_FULL_60_25]
MHITAELNYLRMAPRKVRVVADAIRGKRVPEAERTLRFLARRASGPLAKLLKSAIANAKHNFQINDVATLRVREIRVDQGPTLKRTQPRAMGRAFRIHKKSSHICIVLETTGPAPERKRSRKADIAVVTEQTREAGGDADRIEKPSREREGKISERPNVPAPTLARRIFRRKSI